MRFSEHLQIPGIASSEPHVTYHNIKRWETAPTFQEAPGQVEERTVPGKVALFKLSFYVPPTHGGHLHARPGTTGPVTLPRPSQGKGRHISGEFLYQLMSAVDKGSLGWVLQGKVRLAKPRGRGQSPDGEGPP